MLVTEPRRVLLTVGNEPYDQTYSSAHAIFELPDGFQIKVYAAPIEATQRLMMYCKGDRVALGGLISKDNNMHVIEVPFRGRS